MSAVETQFLTDGGQTAASVSDRLVSFIDGATHTIEAAIYDFDARGGESKRIGDALEAALRRGVQVRVVFNSEVSTHTSPRPMQSDPGAIDGLEVPTRPVHGQGALMHHKYLVRDRSAVWTGSTNWTDDSFSREENVIVRVESVQIAQGYATNFEQLWEHGTVEASGGSTPVVSLDDDTTVAATLSPRGPSLSHLVAEHIGTARHRIRVLTPVLTSGPILGTLAEFAGRESFDLSGAYDATQMDEVVAAWKEVPANRWKIAAWEGIAPRLAGKRSTPFAPGSTHDYMHAKAIVAGNAVVTGSFNCSRNGETNAENVLHVASDRLAEEFVAFANAIAARYES